MRKDIVLGAILLVFIVFIINVLVQGTQDITTPAPAPVVENKPEEPSEETMEEKMERWNRGEFTEEEIAELEQEEAREDAAVKEIRELESQGLDPDYEAIWQETRE
jgi:hypothetical protein